MSIAAPAPGDPMMARRDCAVRRLAPALAALLLAAAPAVPAQKTYSAEELFQPFVGSELSHWLVGPIARIATDDEIRRYLSLQTDEEARGFIEAFWAARDRHPEQPGNPVLELFEARAAEADKKFSESAVAGRHTDRGTIHILHGPPEQVEYEELRDVSGPDVELWTYPKKGEPGLDGRRPEREYRFAQLGDLVRFYSPRDHVDPRRRRELSEPGFPSGRPGEPVPGDPGLPRDLP